LDDRPKAYSLEHMRENEARRDQQGEQQKLRFEGHRISLQSLDLQRAVVNDFLPRPVRPFLRRVGAAEDRSPDFRLQN
jgi:hypothetical protein